MIDGSEKRNRQLAFELQNLHVYEKRSNFQLKAVFYPLISFFFFFLGCFQRFYVKPHQ